MARTAVAENDRPVVPWATLALAAAAGLAFAVPRVGAACLYERGPILQGEVWRAWTGHLAHFGPGHLGWNLAVLLPAGCWLERLHPVRVRWLYLVCPLVISATLLVFDRSLDRYAGLSGLATGTLVLLAGRQLLVGAGEPAWIWLGVFALLGVKVAWETATGEPLLADGHSFRAVPLAHLSGAVCGLLFGAGLRREFPRRR
ncbi:rhombosortase [Opitutus sp. GAS368]|uniref:rhombosortase n=1 Tax=Opitutus sp. GAS368 TaxID=1882749 RepID=UPI00087BF575|nr:rhombosortase [Opitutus sp. GAS368]SDS42058.1 rhomboid family GlyGly-CTERM serine protease [Opitutus sp. GAS368]